MFFEELTDDEWVRLAPLAADEPMHPHRRGRPRAEPRVVANAVLWILTTGERWSKLPARYPSGPTCRRRFDDWLADGTLAEIVKVLSQFGRAFAYVPEPEAAPQPAPKAAPVPAPESPRLRGVFWTNPESWQSTHDCVEPPDGESAESHADAASNGHNACAYNVRGEAPAASSRRAPPMPGSQQRVDGDHPHDGPLVDTMLATKGSEAYRDYLIHVSAQPIEKQLQLCYRASAEIVKDDRRVERSGFIGPRFGDSESAERYALDWARDWIDRHEAAAAAVAAQPCPAAVEPTVEGGEPVQTLPAAEVEEAAAAAPALAAVPASQPVPRAIEPSVIVSRAPEWLMRSPTESRGDAKPPELLYHA